MNNIFNFNRDLDERKWNESLCCIRWLRSEQISWFNFYTVENSDICSKPFSTCVANWIRSKSNYQFNWVTTAIISRKFAYEIREVKYQISIDYWFHWFLLLNSLVYFVNDTKKRKTKATFKWWMAEIISVVVVHSFVFLSEFLLDDYPLISSCESIDEPKPMCFGMKNIFCVHNNSYTLNCSSSDSLWR